MNLRALWLLFSAGESWVRGREAAACFTLTPALSLREREPDGERWRLIEFSLRENRAERDVAVRIYCALSWTSSG